MKKRFQLVSRGGIAVCFGLLIALPVFGYQIQKLTNVPVENDFTVGPGKIEVFLAAGESEIRNLNITNRLGRPMTFKIEIEDFVGSPTGESAAILLGKERSPYSLRDYLKPELTEFTLEHGEKIILPIKISLPEDAEPGGFYGSVLVSTSPPEGGIGNEKEDIEGQIRLVARIGSLFFVRVAGEAKTEGWLEKFNTADGKKLYSRGPIAFSLAFKNRGNVHLVPYGTIEITNFFGKKISQIEIDPYFVMPESLRYRQVRWERELALGVYTATLHLNRGYNDIIDTAKISFWIIPWQMLLIVLIVLIILIVSLVWVFSHFEIRRRKQK